MLGPLDVKMSIIKILSLGTCSLLKKTGECTSYEKQYNKYIYCFFLNLGFGFGFCLYLSATEILAQKFQGRIWPELRLTHAITVEIKSRKNKTKQKFYSKIESGYFKGSKS